MAERFYADEQAIIQSGQAQIDREELTWDRSQGMVRTLLTSKVLLRDGAGNKAGIVGTGRDITGLKETERRSASAERLESIGRLAAGVAHEINTPVQYVSDSGYFFREGVQELLEHIQKLHSALPVAPAPDPNLLGLEQELPAALERVADGLERISEIVRSMKDFSYPDSE